ncbi:MAG: glycosyltransferase family 2 protein [Myxococcales bacterium]|nr:glycosyltransferase family 2 protein [Myxococcales bacterium]
MTPRRPTLSACLIVRDEEALLPGCLASLAGLADELVVVDTGSADRTVEIARAHGARVERFTWIDDFAAARNASLAAARGDWILVIDADERLAPGAADAIRAVMAAPAPPRTAWMPLIQSVDAHGAILGADHMPRLWRRDPALRFAGRIHEQLVADAPIRRVVDDRICLIHLGYDPAITAARDKRARNRALLLTEQAERPADLGVTYHLAKEDYAAGDDAAALAGFARVIAAGPPNLALSAALFAVECLRHLDRAADAAALAARWLGLATPPAPLDPAQARDPTLDARRTRPRRPDAAPP